MMKPKSFKVVLNALLYLVRLTVWFY